MAIVKVQLHISILWYSSLKDECQRTGNKWKAWYLSPPTTNTTTTTSPKTHFGWWRLPSLQQSSSSSAELQARPVCGSHRRVWRKQWRLGGLLDCWMEWKREQDLLLVSLRRYKNRYLQGLYRYSGPRIPHASQFSHSTKIIPAFLCSSHRFRSSRT